MMGLWCFQGDLNGHKGLVPSNFLQAFPETEEDAARTEHTVIESRRDSQVRVCVCVCVCVCTGFCGLRGQNLFNNMGMTEVLQFEGVL